MTRDELQDIVDDGFKKAIEAELEEQAQPNALYDHLRRSADNAHDAAVERVVAAISDLQTDYGSLGEHLNGVPLCGSSAPGELVRTIAEAAIAAYKQGQVTDEKLWAEYKRGREQDVAAYEATVDRRSVYGATAK